MLVKTVLKSKKIFQSFWQIMPIKPVFFKLGYLWNISGFGIVYKILFDKVSLNVASCQTADSTVSVRTSK